MTEQNQEDLTRINDVREMGNVVTTWHFNLLNQLNHVLQMPPEAGIDIPTGTVDADGNPEYIDGNEDHRAGFLTGIQYAFELLDTFPIKGQAVDEHEQSAAE